LRADGHCYFSFRRCIVDIRFFLPRALGYHLVGAGALDGHAGSHLVVAPVLATGNTATAAIDRVKERE
jgi:hypothetical protein